VSAGRLLVTGASGFVGAAVVSAALDRGHEVTALVGPASRLDRLTSVLDDVEIVRADLREAERLEQTVFEVRPAACVHLGAAGAVVRENDLDTLLAVNVLAPAVIARGLARAGAGRLVTAGSSSEYGPVDGVMDERLAPDPDDAYGVSKLAGGLLARVLGGQAGLETVHMRLFSVYGPGEDQRRLVPSVIRSLLTGTPVALTPGGQVRDFIYVDDVADALLEAVAQPGVSGITLNVGSGVQSTVRELCLLAAGLTGGEELLGFGEVSYRPGERFSWRASTELTERALRWKANVSLREGVALTVEAARAELNTQVTIP
jgi:UDP-glucose 4-epimerase